MVDLEELQKRAKGKLVVLGFDLDRVAGIFSTVDKAEEAVREAPDRYDHNWWIEFRTLDAFRDTGVFQRVIFRTRRNRSHASRMK